MLGTEDPQESAEFYADAGLLNPTWAGTVAARLSSDRSFLSLMLEVEATWTRVLADAGLGSIGDAERAEEAVKTCSTTDLLQLARDSQGGGNPLIPALKIMRSTVGSSRSLHLGATSQDIMDTAMMMMARRTGQAILDDLTEAVRALVALARTHADTPMVARSLGQHSLPSTFGLRVAGWAAGLTHAAENLENVLNTLPLQWFGAAGTMASLTTSVQRSGVDVDVFDLLDQLAEKLDLKPAAGPWDTIRVLITDLASALANINVACGKIANDVLISARLENGELTEPTAPGRGGSSAMPHKQNPVLSVMINSATLSAPGILSQVYSAAGAANEERPDGAWHAEWPALRQLMRTSGGAAALTRELVTGLVVHPERMQANLNIAGPLLVSERIMSELAPLVDNPEEPGSGRARIQQVIDAYVADRSLDLRAALRELVDTDTVSDADLDAMLDVTAYTGQSTQLITRMLARPDEWSTHR